MPERTHLKSQPEMPKSRSKSLKAPTFIQSIRSTFSLRRRLGCSSASSSATAIRMSADWHPRTQSNTTTTNNNSRSRNSKKNANLMMSKQRKVVVVATRSSRRHRQQQFVDLESPPATPISQQARDMSVSDRGQVVAKNTLSTYTEPESPERSDRATSPVVTTVALDTESVFKIPRSGMDVFRTSRQRRVLYPSPEEITELLMHQTNILMGRSDSHDRFRDWRLDTDDMTYEQLLALGDKIGYVSTGLKESEILCCVKKIKFLGKTSMQIVERPERKCSICQEEYEPKDKLGLLKCIHSYHRDCIKQWLRHKKICPVCKSEVKAWH